MGTLVAERRAGVETRAGAPTGSPDAALAHAWRLLTREPALALAQAREVLRVLPACAPALQIMGLAQAALGQDAAARASLAQAARRDPELPCVWLALGDLDGRLGDAAAAQAAYLRHVEASAADPELMRAGEALADNRLNVAESLLKARLRVQPTDVAAIRMLAELAARLGRLPDAEALLIRALELAPGFTAARRTLAGVLHRQGRSADALIHVERLIAADPADTAYLTLQAAVLAAVGAYARSLALYEDLLARHGEQPLLWLSYGHVLKTVGRASEAVTAYRRCLAVAPGMGEAWWSLANLKTVGFSPADRAAMQRALAAADGGVGEENRLHLHYALGKALEDEARYDDAFGHYAQGAAIQRERLGYDAAETGRQVARAIAVFDAPLFARNAGLGDPSPDPIFILGLPRSGSTLIEQILSSHSAVEGTMELAEVAALARRIGEVDGAAYPQAVADLDGEALAALGRRYLERTRIHRTLGRPLFIDKMPNNWLHAGLIRLILPNARIVDARRHPMASCFSAFKQHFARGQAFSYGLDDLGRYYRDYLAMMAHLDAVQPGAVHRVIYEDLVEDTETQVRRLLDYCGLAFEPACLRFHETARAVRTASSEQVRRPIFREGLERWRRFESHLDPLRDALGPALDDWRRTDAPRRDDQRRDDLRRPAA